MNCSYLKPTNLKTAILLLFWLGSLTLAAQNEDICKDDDCSPALMSIQLNQPRTPTPAGTFSAARTNEFIAAYKRFDEIKKSYADSEWQKKRKSSQIGGKNCLRHYQLESSFAHEYSQNPDFKNFIDKRPGGSGNFMEHGFESSRRGLNLETRMKRKCPEQLRDYDNRQGPERENLPGEYDKLGKDLGYFDDEGNMLKPMEQLTQPDPATTNDGKKMSKKEQVNQLKQQVAALPVGQSTQDKINDVKNDLTNARPKVGLLKKALGVLSSRLGTFLPGPLGLTSKLQTVNDLLGTLKNFVPKISVPGLLSKIGNLFKKGKGLSDKAKGLVSKSNDLKDKFDNITRQADKLQDVVDKKIAKINDLQNTLDELARKKAELTQKLEDKPKKILDELKGQVADVKDKADEMAKQVNNEVKDKEKLLGQLDELEKAKDKINDELKNLEDEFADLSKAGEDLAEQAKVVEQEVEEVKKQGEKLEDLKNQIEGLKPESILNQELANCEQELKGFLLDITGANEKQEKLKKKMGGLLSWPGKILKKVTNLKLFQDKLKLPTDGIPVADKALAKLENLGDKATAIGSIAEVLTGKKSKLQETIEGYDQKLGDIKNVYDSKTADVDKLKSELVDLIAEKSGIKDQLNGTVADVDALETKAKDFMNRYNIFDEKSDCLGNKDLEDKLKDLMKGQEETEPKVDELEEELKDAEQQEQKLEEATQEVEQEIQEDVQKAEELKQEEEAIKEEYGSDVKLEPVEVEEWAESFEVERPYWDAVFHPDDEVVEGQKGRYFEVKLKDAEKNVKLLFGPGEYCMSKSDFRKRYGSTIGSFVTEALHAMKKSDQKKVKLFIQGSADIAGHKTFSGRLDDKFYYEDISVLPQQEDDSERFQSTPVEKEIPDRNFRNQHLPDLRAQYLADMIKVYSRKFEPVVLEGAVKDFQDEEERNAIIYLFIPEELISDVDND
ncbi:MAG: hypothetical protein AAFZ15_24580 [Bacteroidota bacterium]